MAQLARTGRLARMTRSPLARSVAVTALVFLAVTAAVEIAVRVTGVGANTDTSNDDRGQN